MDDEMKDKLYKIFVGLNYIHKSEIEEELGDMGVKIEEEEETKDIDIFKYDSLDDLKLNLNEQDVKQLLKQFHLKIGGKPQERLDRLWLYKQLNGDLSKIPKKHKLN